MIYKKWVHHLPDGFWHIFKVRYPIHTFLNWAYAKKIVLNERKQIRMVDNLTFVSEYSMHEFMQRHKRLIKKIRPDLWLAYLLTEKTFDHSRTRFHYGLSKKPTFTKEAGKGMHFDESIKLQ